MRSVTWCVWDLAQQRLCRLGPVVCCVLRGKPPGIGLAIAHTAMFGFKMAEVKLKGYCTTGTITAKQHSNLTTATRRV